MKRLSRILKSSRILGKSACRCTGGRKKTRNSWNLSAWNSWKSSCTATCARSPLANDRNRGIVMRHQLTTLTAMAALLLSAALPAAAQTKPYQPHRMADGHPDLQGTYDLATITPV